MPATLKADTIGPVDVAVVLFEGNRFNGDVAPAIAELEANGTVRIVDLTFVMKAADGTVTGVEAADSELADRFPDVSGEPLDLLSEEDLAKVADQLPPGTSALVVVWENTWAARLGGAIRASDGRVLSLERIPHDVVTRAIDALDRG